MKPLIVVGPQGCGKTQLAQTMAEFFGCEHIVDPLESHDPLPSGTLALTNVEPILSGNPRVLSFDAAVSQLIAAGKIAADWHPS
ncbi:DNA polymerase III delta prime subunit [Pseudomonas sp. JUb42]|uniref:ATP-binding protein n=1 Tax=Pseudomonas sp. JUb42 TaxID=2940611 RepID=UPI00216724DF|nr:ATP-binding protein [Pseudomonas sp. JUb42]MCS3467414.1 DNA polymerase III delta prime subunit [Pseudomonas sp. JUb42]